MIDEKEQSKPLIAINEETAGHSEEIVTSETSDKQTKIIIYRHYCKGCEICAEVCPKGVLHMALAPDRWEGTVVEVINIDACNACMLCEHQCPDFAIEVRNIKREMKKKGKSENA